MSLIVKIDPQPLIKKLDGIQTDFCDNPALIGVLEDLKNDLNSVPVIGSLIKFTYGMTGDTGEIDTPVLDPDAAKILADIVNYIQSEGYPAKYMASLLIIATKFNWSKEAEVMIHDFANHLFDFCDNDVKDILKAEIAEPVAGTTPEPGEDHG